MTRKVRQICVSLDERLVDLIDRSRGLIPRSRYVAQILENWARERVEEAGGAPTPSPKEVTQDEERRSNI